MPWWKIWNRDERPAGHRPDPEPAPGRHGFSLGKPIIRDAERRRLQRLRQRRDHLLYDIQVAETALYPRNRWTERIEELDEAIKQAEAGLGSLNPEPRQGPGIHFPDTPIDIIDARPADPATVTLEIAGARFVFREEPDWAERGHRLALPQLSLAEGDVGALLPGSVSPGERDAATRHIAHSLSLLANEALARAVDGEPLPSYTLADLGRPCPRCGGLLDLRGRCPACTALEWRRQEIRQARDRLIDERNDVHDARERARERLPVLRRQLAETEADIAALEAKGVEPG